MAQTPLELLQLQKAFLEKQIALLQDHLDRKNAEIVTLQGGSP